MVWLMFWRRLAANSERSSPSRLDLEEIKESVVKLPAYVCIHI
jgi:hypothetical protein